MKIIWKNLENLSAEQYKKIKAVRSRPGILYELFKDYKAITVCPQFKHILSAIGTPSYKLAKFLVPKLSSISFNEFTVKSCFAFAEETVHQDSKLFMGSLDVDSLFNNIPLEETINAYTNLLYNNYVITAQKMKFSIEDFYSKCDEIRRKLRIWSHLLKKSLTENFIFCAVYRGYK